MSLKISPEFLESISPDHEKELCAFFAKQDKKHVKVWEKGTFTSKDAPNITFSNHVVQRKRKEGRKGVRYEVVSDELLGKGNFGEVYKVAGTLIVDEGKIRFKRMNSEGRKRAIKIQYHTDRHPSSSAEQEYELSNKASHLAVKPPTIVADASYTVMAEIPGKELLDLINVDLQKFTVDQRIKLTEKLLSALQKQATNQGIMHRDIKIDNILVNPNLEVNIIDYGLSTSANKPDGRSSGAPAYAAPEIFLGGTQTPKLDVFSMAKVIALIWNVDRTSYQKLDEESSNAWKARCTDNASNFKLTGLFKEIKDLDDEQKSIINATLEAMLKPKIVDRISIDHAIYMFSKLDSYKTTASKRKLDSKVDIDQIKNRFPAILAQANLLRAKAYKVYQKGEWRTADKLSSIAIIIKENISKLNAMDSEKFRNEYYSCMDECQQGINHFGNGIDQNSHYNYILVNIALAIAGLGVFYLAAGLAKKAYTGHFAFFKETQSNKLVHKVENNLILQIAQASDQ